MSKRKSLFRFLKEDQKSVIKKDEKSEFINFISASGESYEMTKDDYKVDVLPGIFEKAWNSPGDLYVSIIMAFDDGFNAESMAAAQHLYEIDDNRERGSTILGIAYLKNKQFLEAQKHYENYISEHGKSGVVLCNLAKSYSFQGNDVRAKEVLWESLELDPNVQNTVEWMTAMEFECGGEERRRAVLEHISSLPNSWYADLWLARSDIEAGNRAAALIRYDKILELAPGSSDALYMISGDLGKNGLAEDVMEKIFPIFDLDAHGVNPAMNMLQACAEVGDSDKGVQLLRQLRKLARPDIIEHIEYYESIFSQRKE